MSLNKWGIKPKHENLVKFESKNFFGRFDLNTIMMLTITFVPKAIQCGVPVVPGTPGPISTLAEAEEFIAEHGFPIIIKAAMGGGGRGMRVVREINSLADSFERAKSEALSAFGDGTVFLERFLD